MSTIEYYEELEVIQTSSLDEIKKSYRRLALLHHPDRGGDAEKFKKISHAYEVLSDPQKRQNYDTVGTEDTIPTIDPSGIFSMFFGGGFKDLFMGLRGQMKNPSVTNDLYVSLEELYKGKKIRIECKRKIICKNCSGKGYTAFLSCTRCDCQGRILKNVQIARGIYQQISSKCPECDKGKAPDPLYICTSCKGEKIVSNSEIEEIDIKPGTEKGYKITLTGKGDELPETIPGDIIIVIKEKDHPIFKRDGKNLIMEKNLTLKESLCGFELNITHLDKRIICIKREDVTPDGYIHEIKSEGMNMAGNLYIHCKVEFPITLTDIQKKCILKYF